MSRLTHEFEMRFLISSLQSLEPETWLNGFVTAFEKLLGPSLDDFNVFIRKGKFISNKELFIQLFMRGLRCTNKNGGDHQRLSHEVMNGTRIFHSYPWYRIQQDLRRDFANPVQAFRPKARDRCYGTSNISNTSSTCGRADYRALHCMP